MYQNQLCFDDQRSYSGLVACLQGPLALRGLSDLTTLTLDNVKMNDGAVAGIAACTQLRDLHMCIPNLADEPLTFGGLQRLTQLTRLTKLRVYARLGMKGDRFDEDLVSCSAICPFTVF